MSDQVTDYYLNADESVAAVYKYSRNKNYSYRETEFLDKDEGNSIWSDDGVRWLHIRNETKQYTVSNNQEPPKSLQMAILIGAI